MADCTREGECSPAAKRREIVGRNGSAWRFDPFANQIAIIDGNNHTVETISPRISASLPPSPSLPLSDHDFFPPCLIQGNPRPCLTHRRCIDGRKMLTIFFCVNTIFFFIRRLLFFPFLFEPAFVHLSLRLYSRFSFSNFHMNELPVGSLENPRLH